MTIEDFKGMTKEELQKLLDERTSKFWTLLAEEAVRSERIIEQVKAQRETLLMLHALLHQVPEIVEARLGALDKALGSKTSAMYGR